MKIPAYQRKISKSTINNRLVYYTTTADSTYWDELWLSRLNSKTFDNARKGKLAFFYRNNFLKYLPKEGLIIEAGCGTGHLAFTLQTLNYNIDGVEWAEKTVETVKNIDPTIPIRTGDVCNLDAPDEYYAAYISIGVVEHEQQGPQVFLEEAYRVLTPGGIMIITVPFFNTLRRLKRKLGCYQREFNPANFYQYLFTQEDFSAILKKQGFEIVEVDYYSGITTLLDEIPFSYLLFKVPMLEKAIAVVSYHVYPLRKTLSHMLLIVARKPEVRL